MTRRHNYHLDATELPCIDCKKVLPRTKEFFYTTPLKNGKALDLTCKKCRINSHTPYSKKSREFKDKFNVYQQEYSKMHPKIWRKQHLKRKGITLEQYHQLLIKQFYRCAICNRPQAIMKKRFSVDHDHRCCPSNKKGCQKCIRGLLCMDCNVALGHVRDDIAVLKSMIAYLESTNET